MYFSPFIFAQYSPCVQWITVNKSLDMKGLGLMQRIIKPNFSRASNENMILRNVSIILFTVAKLVAEVSSQSTNRYNFMKN